MTTKIQLLHACKKIVKAERVLNVAVDELLELEGITREEIKNDKHDSEFCRRRTDL